MLVLLLLSTLFGTPEPSLPTPKAQLDTAAALFAMGREKEALKKLEQVKELGGDWAKRSELLLFAHRVCQGKVTPPPKRPQFPTPTIRFFAQKTGSFPFLGTPKKGAFPILGQLLTTMVFSLCHYSGKLHLADLLLHQGVDPATRSLLMRWVTAYVRVAPGLSHKQFSPLVALRILAQKKLDNLLGQGNFTEEEERALDRLIRAGSLPFPDGFPWRISALLPLSGRYKPFGKQMLLALLAAQNASPGLELVVHNTHSSPALTRKLLLEEVLLKDRPLALIAPPDSASLKAIYPLTGGLPVFNLSTTLLTGKAPYFSLQLPREYRARALAQKAYELGARRFAVIAPKTPYGAHLKAAFLKALTTLGATLVRTLEYTPKRMPRSFHLKGVDAVFVPDVASRVERVSRVMAASGYFARPKKAKKAQLLLLTTAEGLSPLTLKNSARYLQGALFAPGYYGLKEDSFAQTLARWGIRRIFVQAYESYTLYGLLLSLVRRGATTHKGLLHRLRALSAGPGLGPLFTSFGQTTRPVRLYQMSMGSLHPLLGE